MTTSANYREHPETWQLDAIFKDVQGDRITCGDIECGIGVYTVESKTYQDNSSSQTVMPACNTCVFGGDLGDLGDVFNPAEPRFQSGAPECFKRAAALIYQDLEICFWKECFARVALIPLHLLIDMQQKISLKLLQCFNLIIQSILNSYT